MMRLVAPSILSADFLRLDKAVELVNDHADLLHLDVMDGVFVPNISFGFPVLEAVKRAARKPVDVHLMISRPSLYVRRFAEAGADGISFHLEASEQAGEDPAATLRAIRSAGAKAGLVINPDIPAERLFPYLEEADYVLVMSVFAGFGGQKFIEDTYGKIAAVRAEILRRGLPTLIEVDGGVGPGNADALAAAGASIFVAGASVFGAEDPAGVIRRIAGR